MLALAPPEEWSIPLVRRRVSDPTGEPPGTIVIDTSAEEALFRPPGQSRRSISGRRPAPRPIGWTGRATVGHMAEWPQWMPTYSIMSRWPEFKVYLQARAARRRLGQPARRARALPLSGQSRHALSHPRHQRAVGNRAGGLVGLHPHARPRRDRPLQPRPDRNARRRQIAPVARPAALRISGCNLWKEAQP